MRKAKHEAQRRGKLSDERWRLVKEWLEEAHEETRLESNQD
jgi:hypothetical protein